MTRRTRQRDGRPGPQARRRLALDELADRLDRALAAVTRAELQPLTTDLPAQSEPAPSAAKGRRWIIGIMGGDDLQGRWRIASRCTVVNLMGGTKLDLSDAIVEGSETVIRVFSLMGGSYISVPGGVHVELGGFAFMGGNDMRLGEAPAPSPCAPTVRVRAYSIMGGTDIKRRPATAAGPSRAAAPAVDGPNPGWRAMRRMATSPAASRPYARPPHADRPDSADRRTPPTLSVLG